MAERDNESKRSVAGAMYFIVGRGTEGGPSSYRLSVAGVTDAHWGDVSRVVANSGYSVGTIQVDMGQRGTWPLGATEGTVQAGPTYVDALIEQSAAYAESNGLPYPDDRIQLRADLLSHGNGLKGRSSISFIDQSTRSSINEWASSSEGKKWIHQNIDYPQVKSATEVAEGMIKVYGKNIDDDRRLETTALLVKTANQWPSQLHKFKEVMESGGSYDDVISVAEKIKAGNKTYDGLAAVAVAEKYKQAFDDASLRPALVQAELKVASKDYDPGSEASDPDVRAALEAIGQRPLMPLEHQDAALRVGSRGERVVAVQLRLAALGVTDQRGLPLRPDGDFGPSTKAAVQEFQMHHGLAADGIVGRKTEELLSKEFAESLEKSRMSLADKRHPGASLYSQALSGVSCIDEKMGRASDQASLQLAGSLTVAACAGGLTRIDHVVMSDDGSRAYAVQGDVNSPFKRYSDVDVARSLSVSLEQSGEDFLRAAEQHQRQVQKQAPEQPHQGHSITQEQQPMSR
jgi:peptidoglycan hydrolase-like protein with peptidoglycan-binding domain